MTNQEKIIKILEITFDGLTAQESFDIISNMKNFKRSGEIKVEFRTLESIQKDVCEYFGMTPDMVNLRSRKPEIVQARQFAHYKAKIFTDKSYREIGEFFGKKDEGTARVSFERITGYLRFNRKFREQHEEFLRS